jgi:hypothetical protein
MQDDHAEHQNTHGLEVNARHNWLVVNPEQIK